MNSKTRKAVIFDLDQTLYPLSMYLACGYKAVAGYVATIYGMDIYPQLLKEQHNHNTEETILTVMSQHFRYVEDHLLLRLTHVFHGQRPLLRLYPDAGACLAILKTRGIKTGLVTSGDPFAQRAKVEALGLMHLVDAIVHAGDLAGNDKDSDALNLLSMLLEEPFENITFTGNSATSDFSVPCRLSLPTAAVRRAGDDCGQTCIGTPNLQVATLTEVDTLLNSGLNTIANGPAQEALCPTTPCSG